MRELPPFFVTLYTPRGGFAIFPTSFEGVLVLLESLKQPIDPALVKVSELQDGKYVERALDLFR